VLSVLVTWSPRTGGFGRRVYPERRGQRGAGAAPGMPVR
jgi:hypothetical protein